MTLWSCEKFEGDQTIPAYLKIDSIALTTDYSVEGTSSNAITDAWVYIDDQYLGTFQLPARFPVLRNSTAKVTIFGGVKKDGIAATRINYPYYQRIDRTIKFVQDSTISLGTLSTVYESKTRFIFKEDFEQVTMLLDTTSRSNVAITRTASGSGETFEGEHSGIVTMDSVGQYFEIMSHDPIDIPNAAVYLEINCNTNIEFQIGLFIYSGTYAIQADVLNIMETKGKWKKIYVDLSNMLNAYGGAEKFRLSLRGNFKETGVDQAKIMVDNLKLVTLGSAR